MTEAEYRALAKQHYATKDGDVEVDEDAKVSFVRSFEGALEDGAYVQAWVWVERPKPPKKV